MAMDFAGRNWVVGFALQEGTASVTDWWPTGLQAQLFITQHTVPMGNGQRATGNGEWAMAMGRNCIRYRLVSVSYFNYSLHIDGQWAMGSGNDIDNWAMSMGIIVAIVNGQWQMGGWVALALTNLSFATIFSKKFASLTVVIKIKKCLKSFPHFLNVFCY